MGECKKMCTERKSLTTLEDFLARLEHYVNIDTPSGYKEGLDFQSAQLKAEFEAIGCKVITHERPGGNLLECRLGTGSKQILMIGHMDTVFDVGTVAKRPFRREGNKLYGPGVLDMKSGDLMILEIMRNLADKIPEDYCLCGLLNCDEEIGSKESKEKIMELGKASIACLCMEPSKPGYCTVARKGLITFRVKTSGVAAHSGVNYHLGFSAIQGLCNIITKLYTLRDDEACISINIGGMVGGVDKGNIVADAASCIGEVRYYKPELTDGILEKLKEFTGDTGVDNVTSQLVIEAIRPPMQQSEASKALYELARQAAEANGLEMIGRTHGGGSDGSYVAYVGTPVVDGMGSEGEFSHTVEEYVRVDTLMARLQTCIDLIASLMK